MTRQLWFALVDGGRARLVERVDGPTYRTIRAMVSPEIHRRGSALEAERPVRVHERIGEVRHSVEPRVDPRDKVESAFVGSVAAALATASAHGDFEAVALVAPSRLLATLVDALPQGVRVAGTQDADLTKVRDQDLADHLEPMVRRYVAECLRRRPD